MNTTKLSASNWLSLVDPFKTPVPIDTPHQRLTLLLMVRPDLLPICQWMSLLPTISLEPSGLHPKESTPSDSEQGFLLPTDSPSMKSGQSTRDLLVSWVLSFLVVLKHRRLRLSNRAATMFSGSLMAT